MGEVSAVAGSGVDAGLVAWGPGSPQIPCTELKPGPTLWQLPQDAGQGPGYTASLGRLPFPRTRHGSLLQLPSPGTACCGSLLIDPTTCHGPPCTSAVLAPAVLPQPNTLWAPPGSSPGACPAVGEGGPLYGMGTEIGEGPFLSAAKLRFRKSRDPGSRKSPRGGGQPGQEIKYHPTLAGAPATEAWVESAHPELGRLPVPEALWCKVLTPYSGRPEAQACGVNRPPLSSRP